MPYSTGGILPAPRLTVHVEADDRPADQSALTVRRRFRVHRVDITDRFRGVFRDDVDVALLLDQPFRHPRGIVVALKDQS